MSPTTKASTRLRLLAVFLVPAAVATGGCSEPPAEDMLHVSGHIEATDVRVATKIPGRLETLRVDTGSAVDLGQELAHIDTVDVELALAAARAELGQAEAQLQLLLAGARPEDIAEAEAQLAQVEAEQDGARRELDRVRGLYDRGSGTQRALDDAETRAEAAAARVEAARERLRRLRAGSRREEIAAARARVDAARARIAQLQQQVRDAEIDSPVAGIVTEKLAEQGELLAPGAGVVVVTDLAHAWLTVWVSEPDLGRIRIGGPATVVTDDGQTRDGTVSFVASRAEFTPRNVQTRDERVKLVYEVRIRMDNADGLFKPGMPAEARIPAAAGAAS